VRLALAAVDDVRRRIQREHTGHRGHRGDPLYGIRRLLPRSHDHHSERSWERLLAGLDAGDAGDEQLTRTWVAALRPAIDLPQPREDPRRRTALPVADLLCRRPDPRTHPTGPHHRLLAPRTTGLLRHRRSVQWAHRSDQSTDQKDQTSWPRIRNFDNYRRRLLLHCDVDWNTIRVPPIRGRLPRLAA
jgi:transposase